ncbi:MAG: phage tail tape measure protein [Planctomycetota bacterium]
MATFAEKLIAVVGADITQYVDAVGRQVPKIARAAASSLKSIGRVGAGSFRLLGHAASVALAPLRAVASVVQRMASWTWVQFKRGAVLAAAGLAAAVRESMAFGSAMAEVWTILDVGKDRLDALGREIRRIAVGFGETPQKMAKAAYQAISAGIPGAGVGGFLQTAGKSAVAGVSDTFTAVDVLTTVLNSYGMQAERAEYVSDLLFKTVELGKTTFNELAGRRTRL